ncbi:hypothetical protein [Galbibacter sp. BG1]
MTETIELRNKPELKIILNTHEFEVIDASEPKNNGTYSYAEIKSVKLNTEKTDWFISITSYIVGFFTGNGNGGNYKNKANLTIQLTKQIVKIWLVDTDFKKVEEISELIKNKSSYIKTL